MAIKAVNQQKITQKKNPIILSLKIKTEFHLRISKIHREIKINKLIN